MIHERPSASPVVQRHLPSVVSRIFDYRYPNIDWPFQNNARCCHEQCKLPYIGTELRLAERTVMVPSI